MHPVDINSHSYCLSYGDCKRIIFVYGFGFRRLGFMNIGRIQNAENRNRKPVLHPRNHEIRT